MARILLVQEKFDRTNIILGYLRSIYCDPVVAPAIGRSNIMLPRLVGKKFELRWEKFRKYPSKARYFAIVECFGEALAEIEAWPESIGHHHVEVLGTADFQLVECFRVAVKEGRREFRFEGFLEARDRFFDCVGLPHEQPERRRRRFGIANIRAGSAENERAQSRRSADLEHFA